MNGLKFQLVRCAVLLLGASLLLAPVATADGAKPQAAGRMEYAPDELKNITIDEKLNQVLPLDLPFVDDTNRVVKLGDYFGKPGRPVLLQLGYYGCPMLCDLISKGMVDSLRQVELEPGRDYDVVFVSIDPTEKFDLAQKKKRSYVQAYGRGGADVGWHFLTGKEQAIKQLAVAIGFNYKWVPSASQYSHPAAIMVCTPEGKLSRYLYGVRFEPRTVRLSLVEASAGKIGTVGDQILMTCFQYDGRQGKYAMAAMSLMRLGGAMTAAGVLAFLFWVYRREARRRSEMDAAEATGVHAA